MRVQFDDKKQASRFATAVVSVTGREPVITRTETNRWGVQSAYLDSELAYAISSLLRNGVPCQRVTLDQVAERVEAQGWAPLAPQMGCETMAPVASWLLGMGQRAAARFIKPKQAIASA